MPNPTSTVTSSISVGVSDLLLPSVGNVVNRVNLSLTFQAQNVIYNGYANVVNGTAFTVYVGSVAAPLNVLFTRNAGIVPVTLTLQTVGSGGTYGFLLNPGDVFFYFEQKFTAQVGASLAGGIYQVTLQVFANLASSPVEVLAAL